MVPVVGAGAGGSAIVTATIRSGSGVGDIVVATIGAGSGAGAIVAATTGACTAPSPKITGAEYVFLSSLLL